MWSIMALANKRFAVSIYIPLQKHITSYYNDTVCLFIIVKPMFVFATLFVNSFANPDFYP